MVTRMRTFSILAAALGACVLAAALLLGACMQSTRAEEVTPEQRLSQHIDAAERAAREHPDDVEKQLALAKLLHRKGAYGEKDAAQRADEMLQELYEAHPDRPLVAAYAGAAKMMRAQRTLLPWKKGELVKQGGAMIERALEQAGDTPADEEWEVRYVRAVSAASLPEWMEQGELARDEFAELAEVAPEAVRDGRLTAHQAAVILVHHAAALREAGKTEAARRALDNAVELSPDSHAGAEARAALQAMSTPDRTSAAGTD
ncbi:MAG: hypothetical protein ACOC3G_05650 [Phycisphaeraceae bacterium]